MQIRNSTTRFGVVSIVIHWLVALVVFGLFALGLWMVDLDYYHAWYKTGPDIHRSIGILLLALMVFRVVWRFMNQAPKPIEGQSRWEIRSAHGVHLLLYLLLFVAFVSGYLITTADGSSIDVFNWFSVPSVTGRVRGLEDIAGDVHYWTTWAVVVLAGLHAAAALKHHLIDRDDTLRRMLGRGG